MLKSVVESKFVLRAWFRMSLVHQINQNERENREKFCQDTQTQEGFFRKLKWLQREKDILNAQQHPHTLYQRNKEPSIQNCFSVFHEIVMNLPYLCVQIPGQSLGLRLL